jgi:hypothetical protein
MTYPPPLRRERGPLRHLLPRGPPMFRLALILFSLPPASSPLQTSSITPGTYDLEIVYGGGTMPATLEVSLSGEHLTARLVVGQHESPVKPLERKGARLVLESTTPGMTIRYELEFKGDQVTGNFIYQEQTGSVSGRRRAGR